MGFTDPDHVEVIEGISLGEELVTVGNHNLRADTLVRLEGDPDLKEPPEEESGDDEDAPTDDATEPGSDEGSDGG